MPEPNSIASIPAIPKLIRYWCRENIIAVGFTTGAALAHELMEAREERRLLILRRQLSRLTLLIIDELGFVSLSTTGAELLFGSSPRATSGAPSWSPPTSP